MGAYRFHFGKQNSGIVWFFTFGLLGIGFLYDLLTLNGQVDEINRIRLA